MLMFSVQLILQDLLQIHLDIKSLNSSLFASHSQTILRLLSVFISLNP
jgi:hypothetical protein